MQHLIFHDHAPHLQRDLFRVAKLAGDWCQSLIIPPLITPSFVTFDHHNKRLCTLRDFTWLKRGRTERAAGISDAVHIEKVRHYISLDREVHILCQVIGDGENCDRIQFDSKRARRGTVASSFTLLL
jgi:hypothetical protein